MNEPVIQEDETSDSDLGKLEVLPKPEMIRSDYTFKGQPLWPYTLGTRIVFNQLIDTKDKMMFVWAAFVFLLIRRGESSASLDRKKHILPLWESGEMRSAVLDWSDELTEQDMIEAKSIYDKWTAADQATAVEPVPTTRGFQHLQKKTRQKKQPSSAGS